MIIIATTVALVSCGKQDAGNENDKKVHAANGGKAAAEQPEVISVTDWTDRTELFMEYPPLVAGQSSRFAVHLTAMGSSFKPLKSGTVNILLEAPGGTQTFTTTGPSRPGIFGVDVKPERAGAYTMTVQLRSANVSDSHSLGTVTVYADQAAASQNPSDKPKEETIAFLKEQQWALDFATAPVTERAERESFVVAGQVQPRTGGQGEVTAPIEGRLVEVAAVPVGGTVTRGQVLARIAPPTSAPADRPALELAKSEAENLLRFTRHDRERAVRLVTAGAVPVRRLEEAKLSEATAEERLKAAEARLAQYETARQAGPDSPSRLFSVRAPISGTVVEARAVSGANARVGDSLFRIVDTNTVYVAGNVPEGDLPRLRQITGAELQIADGVTKPVGRLISTGRVVDPQSRTVPIVYEAVNADRRLAVGQTVSVRLFTSANTTAPTIPESAVVDDAGRPVVFVQLAGEAFARRPVKLGNQRGGYVQALEGVRPGERVVTKGAYLIRLSSMSSSIPAHGHVH
jgi:cobalt-zinc-cadmium efflux system membrane fusion protein